MNILVLLLVLVFPFLVYAMLIRLSRKRGSAMGRSNMKTKVLILISLLCALLIPLIRIVSIRSILSASSADADRLMAQYADIRYFYSSDIAIVVWVLMVLIAMGFTWSRIRQSGNGFH